MLTSFNTILKTRVDQIPAFAAIITFIADVLTIFYVNYYWLKIKILPMVEWSLRQRGFFNLSNTQLQEMAAPLASSAQMLFLFFLLWHTIIYIFLFNQKAWAMKYVWRYTLMTLILTLIEFVVLIKDFSPWFLLLLTITSLYAVSFLCLHFYKKNSVQ